MSEGAERTPTDSGPRTRPWLATRWDRLNGPARVAGVDLARGLAVLGMFAAHLLWIREIFDWDDPATWIHIVDGRSSILFATLAGVSIGLVTGGPSPLAGSAMGTARLRLVVRAFLLWLLGLLLDSTGVPVYVILQAYGILFVLAVPFTRLRARTLFVVAGAIALVMPFVQVWLDANPFWFTATGDLTATALGWHYPFTVWIAFVLAGLGVARAGILRTRVQVWTLAAGAALATVGYALHAVSGSDAASEQSSFWPALWTARPHSTGLLEVIGTGGFALAVIAACVLLCRTFVVWIVLPLRAVGSMPLTAYTAQLLVWAWVASIVLGTSRDLAGFRDLEPFVPFAVWTVIGCTAWALLVGRGPLEWAFDRLTRLVVKEPADHGRQPLDRVER
ncbi:heparan-alpha-glucosaminide N-acetyltransferase domain-containing protein [Microbacterium immunditiarum]|uniref:Putative membrane protein n=1 Tax=Microbacterium immunditiarum TaxID=337480 RepID=A0A7Y9GQF6_9MICO|nr:heparan-alpha-glucosaminide N-acetyltransferase domain-containing protein [Microbacterium immunditiarum]NYE20731.1 putative membrane protein [Microbacterium immunditiarum]